MATSSATISSPSDFSTAVLKAGHWPNTPGNIAFLNDWQGQEGQWGATGPYYAGASHNPLNTSLVSGPSTALPGAGFSGGVNSANIQSYPTWQAGVAATVQTLQAYPSITGALASNNVQQANQSGALANNLSTWSGGGYTVVGSNPAQNTGSGSGSGAAGAGVAGTASGSGPSGLMGACKEYGYSKNNGSSSCLVSPPGGFCFTACEAKALISGGLILGGAVVMLVGTALLFAGKGPVGKAAQGAVGLLPGVGPAAAAAVREAGKRANNAGGRSGTLKVPQASQKRYSDDDLADAHAQGVHKGQTMGRNHRMEGSRLNRIPAAGAKYADVAGEF